MRGDIERLARTPSVIVTLASIAALSHAARCELSTGMSAHPACPPGFAASRISIVLQRLAATRRYPS